MMMKRILPFVFLLCGLAPSFAQWQTPQYSVPIGRGSGTGFSSAAPGSAGRVLTSNGASANPTFQTPASSQSTSVITCGAVGNGVTDDTAAINSCLANNSNVFFPALNFLISGQLEGQSNQTVTLSAGTTITQSATNAYTFLVDGKTNFTLLGNGGMLKGKGIFCGNIGQPVTGDCPSGEWTSPSTHNDRGIQLSSCTNCIVNDIHTRDYGVAGIAVFGGRVVINNPYIEGTDAYTTPITAQANKQMGIYLQDNLANGCVGVTINNPVITGVTQGILTEAGAAGGTLDPDCVVNINGGFIYSIPGQHATYTQRGLVNITGLTVSDTELAAIKLQIADVAGPVHGFSAVGIIGNNVGSNLFEMACITGFASSMADVRIQGVGYGMQRGLSMVAAADCPISQFSADVVASNVTEGVVVQGSSYSDVNVKAQIHTATDDCFLITAVAIARFRLYPEGFDCGTSGRYGLIFSSASTTTGLSIYDARFLNSSNTMLDAINIGANNRAGFYSSITASGATGWGLNNAGIIDNWPLRIDVNGVTGNVTNTGTMARQLPTNTTTQAGVQFYRTTTVTPVEAAGVTSVWADSTTGRIRDQDSSSVIGTTVVADTGASNNFLTAISAAGVISKAQPTIGNLASIATNTVVGNATSGSASPTALSVGSCSTASSALIWTTNTGFGCNTSITAAAVPVGGITDLGTGVATALAVNVGTAGSPVVNGGALGTPSSGTLTNTTGFPLANLSGAGSGVLTFLATPSSANLRSAMTDESGTGVLIFAGGNIGAATATSLNGLTISTTTGTLTLTNAKTLSVSNTLTLAGTDGTTMTFPSTTATIARTDAGQTFTGTNNFGTLTATTVNGNTVTTSTGTLTLTAGQTLTNTTTTSVGRGQYLGTNTNDAATAGNIGEFISSAVESGSATSATTTVSKTVTSISLTAGDWHVCGSIGFIGNSATNISYVMGGISSSDNTLPTNTTDIFALPMQANVYFSVGPGYFSNPVPCRRVSLSGTTTYYIVGNIGFATNTASIFGKIEARRLR